MFPWATPPIDIDPMDEMSAHLLLQTIRGNTAALVVENDSTRTKRICQENESPKRHKRSRKSLHEDEVDDILTKDAVRSLLALRWNGDSNDIDERECMDSTAPWNGDQLHYIQQHRFLSPQASQIKQANHSMSFILNGGIEQKGMRLPKLLPSKHHITSSRPAGIHSSFVSEKTRRVLQNQMNQLSQLRQDSIRDTPQSQYSQEDDQQDENGLDDDDDDEDDEDDDGAMSETSNSDALRSSMAGTDTAVYRRLLSGQSSLAARDAAQNSSSKKPFSTSWAQRKHNFELLQLTARLEESRQRYLAYVRESLDKWITEGETRGSYKESDIHSRRIHARRASMMYLFQTMSANGYEIGAFSIHHSLSSNVFLDNLTDLRELLGALEQAVTLYKCWIESVETFEDETGLVFGSVFQFAIHDAMVLQSILRPDLHWTVPHLLRMRGVMTVRIALHCRYRTFDVRSMHIQLDISDALRHLSPSEVTPLTSNLRDASQSNNFHDMA